MVHFRFEIRKSRCGNPFGKLRPKRGQVPGLSLLLSGRAYDFATVAYSSVFLKKQGTEERRLIV
jgi:hypothetical protein